MIRLAVILFTLSNASCFTTRNTRTLSIKFLSKLCLSDGNPPPFGNWGSTFPVPVPVPTTSPPSSNYGQSMASSTYSSSTASSDLDIMAPLLSSQATSVREIIECIPDLILKPSLSWTDGSVSISGRPATLTAYDAPGSSNVAWLADVYIPGKLSSLTIFNGPLTDVPHILSRCYMDDQNQRLYLTIDIRPRAYGAYERKDPISGNYPGPEELGRKAFEYSAARSDFFSYSGIDSIQSLLDPSQFENASPGLTKTDYDILTGGPIGINVCLPVTPLNLKRIAAVRECVAGAWRNWVTNESQQHMHRPGAPVNTQYVYDSKFRQNAYLALLSTYTQYFGNVDGTKLAAAESGPLDEAYVGGGS